jgi:hypothetical protein
MSTVRIRKAGALALGTAMTAAALVAVSAPAGAAAPAPVPTITVHMSSSRIALSSGNTIHAGRIVFKVVTGKGDHTLQIARLRNGYTLQQAGADLNKAFSGDIKAIRRVDANIVFRGGAEARPNKPGAMAVGLPAGQFVFIDQNSNAFTMVKVVGKATPRQTLPNRSQIALFTYGFDTMPTAIPHSGWTLVTNRSDQPHFLEIQHVKWTTTGADVRRLFRGGKDTISLPGRTTMGVLTQGQHEAFRYDLPRGKYLIACFWPDRFTGMPHAFMGMWKLIILN